jgi:hypothetical protein
MGGCCEKRTGDGTTSMSKLARTGGAAIPIDEIPRILDYTRRYFSQSNN